MNIAARASSSWALTARPGSELRSSSAEVHSAALHEEQTAQRTLERMQAGKPVELAYEELEVGKVLQKHVQLLLVLSLAPL